MSEVEGERRRRRRAGLVLENLGRRCVRSGKVVFEFEFDP
jgi:hypothetical protein